MDFITEWIQMNPTAFIAVVAAVCICAVVIMAVSGSRAKKKKKALMAQGGLSEVFFYEQVRNAANVVMDGGYDYSKIFSVNGKEPNIIDHSLLVPAGSTTIDLQRVQAGKGMGLNHTNTFPREKFVYDFAQGKKYIMDYNMMDKKYEIKEK